jgi:Holliday junction resolvase RusA-like endonuclease
MKIYKINAYDIKLVSLNKKFFVVRNRNILSTDYRNFKNNLEEIFNQVQKPDEPIEVPCKTRIEVGTYKDLDNIVKPVHDTLQKIGFIKNDSLIHQTLIKKIPIKRGGEEWLQVELQEIGD